MQIASLLHEIFKTAQTVALEKIPSSVLSLLDFIICLERKQLKHVMYENIVTTFLTEYI